MENFSFCSTLKSCIARDFEGGLAVHKMCTLTLLCGQSWPWPRAAYIRTGRGLIQYFPFKFQCRAPGTRQPGPRLMKTVCQDWDLISPGLVHGPRTDNLFQPPKCDRYYILMLPNLNCISQRSPARMRWCAG